jgi:hypothetical protein
MQVHGQLFAIRSLVCLFLVVALAINEAGYFSLRFIFKSIYCKLQYMPEFPLIKTMLISDYLLSNEEIIVKGSNLWNFVQNAVAGLNLKKLTAP